MRFIRFDPRIAAPLLLILLLCCRVGAAGAQLEGSGLLSHGATALGGWGVFALPTDHVPEDARARMQAEVTANIAALTAAGTLRAPLKATAPQFAWPVRAAEGVPARTTHAISNFVDHDPALASVADFACGSRTYDLVGGGHRGTDIFPLFGWRKLDNEEVIVVAAAPGTIVLKQDGNQDRSCGTLSVLLPNASQWNAVSLRHADGSLTWYGHLKKNSLTPKKVGDTVDEGEYLGAVGSSGFSTGPHMHFEVYDASSNLIDPWQGTCNPSTGTSWWKDQPPYYDPQIVMLMPTRTDPRFAHYEPPCDAATHTAPAVPASYYPQSAWYFAPGETAYFVAFVRDVQTGAGATFTLRRPDGAVFSTVTQISTVPYFSGGFLFNAVTFPAGAPAGRWTVNVSFAGHNESMPVFVGLPDPAAATVAVFDFRNAVLDHFFRTASPAEAAAVDAGAAGPGWQRTGDDFLAFSRDAPGFGASAVCRFYDSVAPGPNSHFYTGMSNECNGLKLLQLSVPGDLPRWNYEEIAYSVLLPVDGICPLQAPVPVYRLYNNGYARNDSNHRYTTRSSAYYQQAALGWSREGPVMCANGRP